MSKAKLPPESEVVSWLQQLIEKDELLESILGQEAITSLIDVVDQEYFIPSFGIDYISRRASAEAARHVLRRLGLLDIISINTSISLTIGEVLRPDILWSATPEVCHCISPFPAARPATSRMHSHCLMASRCLQAGADRASGAASS